MEVGGHRCRTKQQPALETRRNETFSGCHFTLHSPTHLCCQLKLLFIKKYPFHDFVINRRTSFEMAKLSWSHAVLVPTQQAKGFSTVFFLHRLTINNYQ